LTPSSHPDCRAAGRLAAPRWQYRRGVQLGRPTSRPSGCPP